MPNLIERRESEAALWRKQVSESNPFYLDLLDHYREMILEAPDFGTGETSSEHLLWMLDELAGNLEQSATKKHRWLGFIQGCLIAYGVTTVQAERDYTRGVFNGA